jgi:hypothetical protein
MAEKLETPLSSGKIRVLEGSLADANEPPAAGLTRQRPGGAIRAAPAADVVAANCDRWARYGWLTRSGIQFGAGGSCVFCSTRAAT